MISPAHPQGHSPAHPQGHYATPPAHTGPFALPDSPQPLELSVIAPAHNEEGNVERLADEVAAALSAMPRGSWEFIIVDDGSTDSTRARVLQLTADRPWLRCVAMQRTPPGRGNGQSAAFHQGFRAARGRLVASLDADLQNDPADLPRLLDELRRSGADFVQGDRSAARSAGDSKLRQLTSIIGRAFRRALLGDTIRDTGCSLRVMRRDIALALPLEFKGMHRFIPLTARSLGHTVVELPVNHRPRHAGTTKYGAGISKRAIPGLIDCLAVRWMNARRRPVESSDLTPTPSSTPTSTPTGQRPPPLPMPTLPTHHGASR